MCDFLQGVVSLDDTCSMVDSVSAGHCDRLLSAWMLAINSAGEAAVGKKAVRTDGSSKSWFSRELRQFRYSVDEMRGQLLRAERNPLCAAVECERLRQCFSTLHKEYGRACRA